MGDIEDRVDANIAITVKGLLKLWFNVVKKTGSSIQNAISISDICHIFGPVSFFKNHITSLVHENPFYEAKY